MGIPAGPVARGAFRGRARQITACAPKESNRLGATGVHFGACAPQASVKSRLRTKNTNECQEEA